MEGYGEIGDRLLQYYTSNLIAEMKTITDVNISWHIDGLMQERRNSIANALELNLSSTNPLIYRMFQELCTQF